MALKIKSITIIPEDIIALLSEYIDKKSKEMYEFWKEKYND